MSVWIECFDDHGNPYYFDEDTKESSWEPPEWIEEQDPSSGITYYVHIQRVLGQLTLTSQWHKPKAYAKLVRSTV